MKSSSLRVSRQPDLSIVIPAFQEEKRIGSTLESLAAYLHNDKQLSRLDIEVLVVAADATDKTAVIVTAHAHLFKQLTLLQPGPQVGKGRDVQYGMLRARGAVALFMDADLATPLHYVYEAYVQCKSGNDLVIGTRNMRTYRSNLLRGVFASLGNALYRLTSRSAVSDTQCGFKMFTEQACQECFSALTILGWGFDLEVLAIAQAHKLNIAQIPITDYTHMPFSTHHENTVTITLRTLRDYMYIMYKRLTGAY